MTIEEIKDTLQTWIRTADDEFDREEMGRVYGLKSALRLIEKLDVTDINVGDLISRQAAKSKAVYSSERHEKVVPVAELDWLPSIEQEKCGDCISREELKQKFQWIAKATKYGNEDAEQQNFSYSTMMMYEIADMIEDAIDNCSSVEPERKPGKWIMHSGGRQRTHAECSNCGMKNYAGFVNYCPNCGSKMEK